MSKKPNLSAVKSAMHKDKFKHGSMAVVFTAVFIAIIIVVNILVSALSDRFPSMNFDMTLEGLNTLSEEAVDVAKGIESDTTACRSSTVRSRLSSSTRTATRRSSASIRTTI